MLALFPLSASGHDQLIEIDPPANAVIEETNFVVTLIFNNPLLVVEGETNAELATKLVGSEAWVDHVVSIEDRTLKSDVELFEAGDYTLRWKVVSSDGHPISGESTFTLKLEQVEEEQPSEQPLVISPNPVSEQPQNSLDGFYIGLAMVALGAIFAPIGLLMRRKARKS